MNDQMIVADSGSLYNTKEAGVLIIALGWVIAIGSVALASIIICGWKGAKSVYIDWLHMRATFNCR